MPRIDRYLRAPGGPAGFVTLRRASGRAWTLSTLLVVLLIWWWWPGLSGHGDTADVALIGTESLNDSQSEISRRLREEGFSVQWLEAARSWCDLDRELASAGSMIIVVAPADLEECDISSSRIIKDFDDRGVVEQIVVVDLDIAGGANTPLRTLLEAGAQRVATERLLGSIDEELPCVWWEDCAASGRTVTRTQTGLTPHGRDRLARLITAAVV